MANQIEDHLGNKFESFSELCDFWHVAQLQTKTRIYRGWSLKRALEENPIINPDSPKKIVDHEGKTFRSASEMCKYWGVSFKKYIRDIHQGASIKYALTQKAIIKCDHKIKCSDHLGNEYDSVRAMCDFWGVKVQTFYKRLKYGKSLEESLITKSNKKNKPIDHLNQKFKNIKEMAKFYNINYSTLRTRIRRGLSIEDALTLPSLTKVQCEGLNGEKYRSLSEMAKFYNASVNSIEKHLKCGTDYKNALRPKDKRQYIFDHLGNGFPNIQAMCDKHGVKRATYLTRIRSGQTVERALRPERITYGFYFKKKYYKSFFDFADQNGIPQNVAVNLRDYIRNKMKKGIIEKKPFTNICEMILAQQKRKKKIKRGARWLGEGYNFEGKLYASKSDACRTLGIKFNTVCACIRRGMNFDEALKYLLEKKTQK